MSLKAFHILFIVLSVLVTLGFGIWSLRSTTYGSPTIGILSLVASVALVIYGVLFLQKLKREGIK